MLKIFGAPTFNITKVVLTAEEVGLSYDYVPVNLQKGHHKSAEHLARHPLGKVPAIEHDGRPLCESAAICRYLAVVSDSPLYGGDAYQRAVIDQWVDLMAHHAGRWLGTLYFQEYIRPKFFRQPADAAVLKEAREFLDAQLPVIDRQLAERPFLTGTQITIADTIAFSYCHTQELTSVSFDAWPNISRWYQDIERRPAFTRTLATLDVHNQAAA